MIRTIASVVITFLLILGISLFETWDVQSTFSHFHQMLTALQNKSELQIATYEDGTSLQKYWDEKKRWLHVWIPHTSLQEIDFQLDEAVGFLYVDDYEGALPKISVLLGLSEHIPNSYHYDWGNIF